MYLLKLDKENVKLSRYEAETLLGKGSLDNDKLLIDGNITLFRRLALTKKVYKIKGNKKLEIDLGKKPFENINERPGFAPVSLKPKLARVLINLTGSTTNIVDPFCGTGGLLIEAARCGLTFEGYDIDRTMLSLCKKNLEYYNLTGKLKLKNSLNLHKKLDYVVTDLPYGRNTKQKDCKNIIQEFLNILPAILKYVAVIVIPDNIKVVIPAKLKLIKEFKHYIHKNLTKHILIIQRSR